MGIRTEFQVEDEMLKLGKMVNVRDEGIFQKKKCRSF